MTMRRTGSWYSGYSGVLSNMSPDSDLSSPPMTPLSSVSEMEMDNRYFNYVDVDKGQARGIELTYERIRYTTVISEIVP